jgi:hypothetical protein
MKSYQKKIVKNLGGKYGKKKYSQKQQLQQIWVIALMGKYFFYLG